MHPLVLVVLPWLFTKCLNIIKSLITVGVRMTNDQIALILISNENGADASQPGKLLVARSKGKALFYIPGGKRDEGESDHETLCREIDEELDVS